MDKVVFSTDPNWKEKCTICKNPIDECICLKNENISTAHQTAYIARDRKKRRGKTVTTVANLRGDLKALQKELQKHCGAGGTVKNGIIEVQGDHREKIHNYLRQRGYNVKMVGG